MTITTSSFSKALQPGVEKWVNATIKEKPPQYTDIFMVDMINKAFVEEVSLVGLGLAPMKPEGTKITFEDMEQGYIARYTPTTVALGFIVTREMKEDNQYAEIAFRRSKALGFSMRQTKETRGANVLNRAFDSDYTMGANHDGKELIANDHPNWSGGTWSNYLATPADLSSTSLEQAIIEMADWTTDKGLKFDCRVTKMVIPPALEFDAATILKSVLLPGTANNDINAIRITNKVPGGYKVNNYLTDTDAWFLLTDHPDGLKLKVRRKMELTADSDSQTQNAMFMATERYAFGWSDAHGVFGSEGA